MQIDANFINDYFDYLKGSDREDRLGPERACAQGWITLNAMRKGIAPDHSNSLFSRVMPISLWRGLKMIPVGIFMCFYFAFSFIQQDLIR